MPNPLTEEPRLEEVCWSFSNPPRNFSCLKNHPKADEMNGVRPGWLEPIEEVAMPD